MLSSTFHVVRVKAMVKRLKQESMKELEIMYEKLHVRLYVCHFSKLPSALAVAIFMLLGDGWLSTVLVCKRWREICYAKSNIHIWKYSLPNTWNHIQSELNKDHDLTVPPSILSLLSER